MAQWVKDQALPVRSGVSKSKTPSGSCCGCGAGQQLQLIQSLAWEPPYAAGVAKTKQNKIPEGKENS